MGLFSKDLNKEIVKLEKKRDAVKLEKLFFSDLDYDLKLKVIQAIAQIDDERSYQFFQTLIKSDDHHHRREAIKYLIMNQKCVSLDYLFLGLSDEDSDIRKYAVIALGDTNSSETVIPLIERLEDEDYYVRVAAKDVLSKYTKSEYLNEFLEGLKHDNKSVRSFSLDALTVIGENSVVGSIKTLLYDKEKEVRIAAARAIHFFNDAQAIQEIVRNLNSESKSKKKRSIELLSYIGHPDSLEALEQFIENEEDYILKQNAESAILDVKSHLG